MSQQEISLLIRHLAGSKKGQLEKFSVTGKTNIRIGRGPENDVAFDPVREDTISREHCRIIQDEANTDQFSIYDCQSKNGTFINDRKITEKTPLFAGDVIRLGNEGPVLEFDLDPRPASHVKKTRVLETPSKETRIHGATESKTALVPHGNAVPSGN